jgi:hypothetical protein
VRLALKGVVQNDGDFVDLILPYITLFTRFEVIVAFIVTIAIFWDVTSCIMVKRILTFRRNFLPPSLWQINSCW